MSHHLPPAFITAVPFVTSRAKQAVTNLKTLENPNASQPACTIVWDQHQDPRETWTRALSTAVDHPDTDRHGALFLEDDVELHPEFTTLAAKAISERPHEVIQFFSIRRSDAEKGSRRMKGRTYLMNQCHYLPAGVPRMLHTFAQTWPGWETDHPSGLDTCLQEFLHTRGMSYWLHVPSLVQHQPWTSEINPRRARTRQSHTYTPQESHE